MDTVVIRKMKKEDVKGVVSIHINGWRTAYRGIIDADYLDDMDVDAKQYDYQNRVKDKEENILVAEQNQKIVGFCRYAEDNRFSKQNTDIDCEVVALYIDYEHKRQGIGTKLFSAVREKMIEKGKRKMIVWCLEKNEPAKQFYQKMGGKAGQEKKACIGGKEYKGIGFLFDL